MFKEETGNFVRNMAKSKNIDNIYIDLLHYTHKQYILAIF